MLIEYKNVNINQMSQQVLRNVTLNIDKGEFIYITGKVGSGKSSFIKTLYGELAIEEGEAYVMEYDMLKIKPKHIPQLRRKIGKSSVSSVIAAPLTYSSSQGLSARLLFHRAYHRPSSFSKDG